MLYDRLKRREQYPTARRNIAEYCDCINNNTHRYEGLTQSDDFRYFGSVLIAVSSAV